MRRGLRTLAPTRVRRETRSRRRSIAAPAATMTSRSNPSATPAHGGRPWSQRGEESRVVVARWLGRVRVARATVGLEPGALLVAPRRVRGSRWRVRAGPRRPRSARRPGRRSARAPPGSRGSRTGTSADPARTSRPRACPSRGRARRRAWRASRIESGSAMPLRSIAAAIVGRRRGPAGRRRAARSKRFAVSHELARRATSRCCNRARARIRASTSRISAWWSMPSRYHSIIVNSGLWRRPRSAGAKHATDLVDVGRACAQQPLHRVLGRGVQVTLRQRRSRRRRRAGTRGARR